MNKITVTVNQTTYQVEIEDINSRPVIAIVDGERFEVAVAEQSAVSAAPAAPPCADSVAAPKPATQTTAAGNTVNAPIPGVITAIKVKVGDQVNPGDELCNLEAMKMNNAIRTTKAGTIAAIHINQGDHVAHGQVLFELA